MKILLSVVRDYSAIWGQICQGTSIPSFPKFKKEGKKGKKGRKEEIKSKKEGLTPGRAAFKTHIASHPKGHNQFHVCVCGDRDCFLVYREVIHYTIASKAEGKKKTKQLWNVHSYKIVSYFEENRDNFLRQR